MDRFVLFGGPVALPESLPELSPFFLMMKRFYRLLPLLLIPIIVGCQTTSEPERREILGSWISNDLAGTVIRMTLVETSRSIDGAGAWIEGDDARAFLVRGALARDEVSLHFDFGAAEPINFRGYFQDADVMIGTLNGGPVREITASFEREDLIE